ncbi:uncharacterized protein LOC18422440 [Amborella trichopoda]|uniref:Uncharacterized protein n=1 Tax=Amborella trichopoda TaxID=13333 RepID=W1NGW4_AMBTC|nr:uncharacterized protein LOC18422440 [Amborella trichopoda]ERM94410.1 hypothetical protein AMTR_s00010p00255510 [Amborella trichopoda]|eukprot:XP_006827173.1 uncharacterized protein LOC18422440 [Amborella trichopoda]
MANSERKRCREEEEGEPTGSPKRACFSDILSLLEADEDEPTEDLLSPVIHTLQQELSSSPEPAPEPNPIPLSAPSPFILEEDEEEGKVMRYLLEASDDELGIPPSPPLHQELERQEKEESLESEEKEGVERGWTRCYDGLWEIEDETANYYTLLESQLCVVD